jgi:phosphohistidine phosphatase
MKTLLLLRHAKSSWGDASLPDFERPLNERGRQAAPLIGKFMREQRLDPQLIVCSPAQRARETVALVCAAAALTAAPRFDKRIYEASLQTLLTVVAELDETAETALMVGHNPGFEELLAALTGAAERMPTAALARITLSVECWTDAHAGTGQLVQLLKPKELLKG